MIHYHGGPIWPERAAMVVWTNRHAFISHYRPEQIEIAAEVSQSFAIDNGAYSIWKRNAQPKVDWQDYYLFVEKWHRHPGFDWAIIPDSITGTTHDNEKLITEWPFEPSVGVPVWHMHEELSHLRNLVNMFPRVAIGSSGEYAQIGTDLWRLRIDEALEHACDELRRPKSKLHGLRMLAPAIFTRLPLSSADSTNVAQNCMESPRWRGYNPPSNAIRAEVLAERIESHTSQPIWTPGQTVDDNELQLFPETWQNS